MERQSVIVELEEGAPALAGATRGQRVQFLREQTLAARANVTPRIAALRALDPDLDIVAPTSIVPTLIVTTTVEVIALLPGIPGVVRVVEVPRAALAGS